MNYYNSYNDYLQKKFGSRVRKLMVDAGFSCPNIDGKIDTKGCIFCNNDAFSGSFTNRKLSIQQQIEDQLNNNRNVKYLAYFQPYTNTYSDPEKLYEIYESIRPYDKIEGIIIGTRPDEIDRERLSIINSFVEEGYYVSIELGVQTAKDETLLFINRGHMFDSVISASEMIREYNIDLGAHIILGLPGENSDDYKNTAEMLSKTGFKIVKIHHLQVFKNTRLDKLYQQGIVDVFSMEDYLDKLIIFLENLSPDTIISRLYSEAREDLLVAPKWNISKGDFLRLLMIEFAKRNSYQGKYCSSREKEYCSARIAT